MPGEAPQGSFEPFDLVRPAGFGYVLKPFKMGSGTLFDCSAMTTLARYLDRLQPFRGLRINTRYDIFRCSGLGL